MPVADSERISARSPTSRALEAIVKLHSAEMHVVRKDGELDFDAMDKFIVHILDALRVDGVTAVNVLPAASDVKESIHHIISTPGFITSTSRGVVPHLTRDHVEATDAVKWVHVPFETFLERSPPIPTLLDEKHPLHALLGFQNDRHLLSMSLRDPSDGRELPPNGNAFINASCIRGVRKIHPEQYRSFVLACNPDIVIALSDIPFTPPPFSQKRIAKSLERSAAWLASLLQPLSDASSGPHRHHALNILVQMAGDVSIPARRAFAASLKESLFGKDAEQIKPYRCLDDGVLGYVFDLIPLRTSLLASSAVASDEEEQQIPNRRTPDTKPLTQPKTEIVLPEIIKLLQSSLDSLSPEKPRIATGASSPHEILRLIRDVGIDLFDVAWAQKAADWGIALDFVFPAPEAHQSNSSNVSRPRDREDGRHDLGHNLYSSQYATDFSRFAEAFSDGASQSKESICPCVACSPVSPPSQLSYASVDVLMRAPSESDLSSHSTSCDPPFTRAYVHHLLHTHEMSAHALLAAHNLAVADAFFASVRHVLARAAPHAHQPRTHLHGEHFDAHREAETFVIPSDDATFERFAEEVERFCAVYDGELRIFGEAKRDWIAVDYARGKGRMAREKAKQGEEDLATKVETKAEVDEAAVD
ncbi:tRNA-guanine(15) transglycosylase-like protein [Phellopilus nigrolimitatus]|nr:tRNA-guanine(15) transglycosylase-like protein [Phellopilus nigrolimitatus]